MTPGRLAARIAAAPLYALGFVLLIVLVAPFAWLGTHLDDLANGYGWDGP
jgi:hypothetical protein